MPPCLSAWGHDRGLEGPRSLASQRRLTAENGLPPSILGDHSPYFIHEGTSSSSTRGPPQSTLVPLGSTSHTQVLRAVLLRSW